MLINHKRYILLWLCRKPKPTDIMIRDVKDTEEPLYDMILDNPYYKRLALQSQQPEGRYISARKVAGDKM